MNMVSFGLAIAAALLVGCSTPKPVTLRFHEEVGTHLPATRVRWVAVEDAGRLPVNPSPSLTERDVGEARVLGTTPGTVLLRFSPRGRLALEELTTRGRGRWLVVLVDEEPVMVWRIDRRITDGEFVLHGDLPPQRVQALVEYLNFLARPRL